MYVSDWRERASLSFFHCGPDVPGLWNHLCTSTTEISVRDDEDSPGCDQRWGNVVYTQDLSRKPFGDNAVDYHCLLLI